MLFEEDNQMQFSAPKHYEDMSPEQMPEVVCIFCPGLSKGLKFNNESLRISEASSLQIETFRTRDIVSTEWNNMVNGQIINNGYTVKNNFYDIHNVTTQKVMAQTFGGPVAINQKVVTLIVSPQTMWNIMQQTKNKVHNPSGNPIYFTLNNSPDIKKSR